MTHLLLDFRSGSQFCTIPTRSHLAIYNFQKFTVLYSLISAILTFHSLSFFFITEASSITSVLLTLYQHNIQDFKKKKKRMYFSVDPWHEKILYFPTGIRVTTLSGKTYNVLC